MEIKKEEKALKETAGFEKQELRGLEKMQEWGSVQDMTRSEADAILSERVEGDERGKEISFGSLESATSYLEKANFHMGKSRAYERQANDLEDKIKRNKAPAHRASEVRNLRKRAEMEKREAERYNRYAKTELSRF